MSVVVIGGTVLDIQAQPTADDLQRGSSVPGHVVQLPGGVGRNIAEATHHLLQSTQRQQHQATVLLVSVIGQDTAADALLASFAHIGMSTEGVIKSSASTPCVVALLDRGGEVAASVADVAAPAHELTPSVVHQHRSDIAAAQLLILDANLQAATLEAAVHVAAAAGVPVMFEPVSVPKAPRCVPILRYLSAISPNPNELLAIADAVQRQQGLSGMQDMRVGSAAERTSTSPQQLLAQLAPAAAVVLQQGLSCIILTTGSMGAALLTLKSCSSPQTSNCKQHHDHHQQQQQQCSSLSASTRALLIPCAHCRATASSSSSSSGDGGGGIAGGGLIKQPTPSGRCSIKAQHIPAAAAAVVNLSGAGDTLTGGVAAALVRGADPLHALAVGIAAACVSVQCELNVPGPNQGLVFDAVQQVARQLLKQQQTWEFPVQAML